MFLCSYKKVLYIFGLIRTGSNHGGSMTFKMTSKITHNFVGTVVNKIICARNKPNKLF